MAKKQSHLNAVQSSGKEGGWLKFIIITSVVLIFSSLLIVNPLNETIVCLCVSVSGGEVLGTGGKGKRKREVLLSFSLIPKKINTMK